jgi:hypothetical protein
MADFLRLFWLNFPLDDVNKKHYVWLNYCLVQSESMMFEHGEIIRSAYKTEKIYIELMPNRSGINA